MSSERERIHEPGWYAVVCSEADAWGYRWPLHPYGGLQVRGPWASLADAQWRLRGWRADQATADQAEQLIEAGKIRIVGPFGTEDEARAATFDCPAATVPLDGPPLVDEVTMRRIRGPQWGVCFGVVHRGSYWLGSAGSPVTVPFQLEYVDLVCPRSGDWHTSRPTPADGPLLEVPHDEHARAAVVAIAAIHPDVEISPNVVVRIHDGFDRRGARRGYWRMLEEADPTVGPFSGPFSGARLPITNY